MSSSNDNNNRSNTSSNYDNRSNSGSSSDSNSNNKVFAWWDSPQTCKKTADGFREPSVLPRFREEPQTYVSHICVYIYIYRCMCVYIYIYIYIYY